MDEAIGLLKKSIKKAYGKKGDKIVVMNVGGVDKALESVTQIKYPASWADATVAAAQKKGTPFFTNVLLEKMIETKGDELPVSAFAPDGILFPVATTQYENAAWPSMFRNGSWKTAFSATSAPWYARMPPFAGPVDRRRSGQGAGDLQDQAGS